MCDNLLNYDKSIAYKTLIIVMIKRDIIGLDNFGIVALDLNSVGGCGTVGGNGVVEDRQAVT